MRARVLLIAFLFVPAAAAAAPSVPGTAELPFAVSHAAAAWTGERVLLVGGFTAAGPADAIVAFDPATGASAVIGRLPAPRAAAASAWNGTHLIVAGGMGERGVPLASVIAVTPAGTVTDVATLPRGVTDAVGALGPAFPDGATCTAGCLTVLGGRDADGVRNSLVHVDLAAGRARREPKPLGTPCAGASGGAAASGTATMVGCNPADGACERVGAGRAGPAWRGAAAAATPNAVWFAGGVDCTGAPTEGAIAMMDIDHRARWVPTATPVGGVTNASLVALPERLILLGGIRDGAPSATVVAVEVPPIGTVATLPFTTSRRALLPDATDAASFAPTRNGAVAFFANAHGLSAWSPPLGNVEAVAVAGLDDATLSLPAASFDGAFVAVVAENGTAAATVHRVTRATGVVDFVGAVGDVPRDGTRDRPAIADGGERVAFVTRASVWTQGPSVVAVTDVTAGTVDVAPAVGDASRPAISGTGRFLAFIEDDARVAFVDLSTGARRVVPTNGSAPDNLTISHNGRLVAFDDARPNGDRNVVVWDALTNRSARLTAPAAAHTSAPRLSGDAFLAFLSTRDDGRTVAHVRDLRSGSTSTTTFPGAFVAVAASTTGHVVTVIDDRGALALLRDDPHQHPARRTPHVNVNTASGDSHRAPGPLPAPDETREARAIPNVAAAALLAVAAAAVVTPRRRLL